MAGLTPPNNDTDQYGYLVTTEYGRSPYNAYQVQNISPQVFGLTRQQAGALAAPVVTLQTALTGGATGVTALVVTALPVGLTSGATILVSSSSNPATTEPDPSHSQVFTLSGAASQGATGISVTSSTIIAAGLPVGSFVAPILLAGLESPVVAPAEEAPVVAPVEEDEAEVEGEATEAADEDAPKKAAPRTTKSAK